MSRTGIIVLTTHGRFLTSLTQNTALHPNLSAYCVIRIMLSVEALGQLYCLGIKYEAIGGSLFLTSDFSLRKCLQMSTIFRCVFKSSGCLFIAKVRKCLISCRKINERST